VTVDDDRLAPMWRVAAELRLPVVIHIADPIAFFDPIDERNERTEELALHPDWHFWPPMESPDGPGFQGFDQLMAAFDRLLGRHPDVTFVGCHVGCASEDLGLVSQLLERHPNLYVDIAARIGELGRQPYSARSFMLRWSDRVLFGTDEAVDPAVCRIYYRFLETFDESFDYSPQAVPPQGRWRIHGLGLPDDVLRRVYNENARRVLGLAGGATAPGAVG
jgi:predicted TIM-barrel fold metal-dependent hydrolase